MGGSFFVLVGVLVVGLWVVGRKRCAKEREAGCGMEAGCEKV